MIDFKIFRFLRVIYPGDKFEKITYKKYYSMPLDSMKDSFGLLLFLVILTGIPFVLINTLLIYLNMNFYLFLYKEDYIVLFWAIIFGMIYIFHFNFEQGSLDKKVLYYETIKNTKFRYKILVLFVLLLIYIVIFSYIFYFNSLLINNFT